MNDFEYRIAVMIELANGLGLASTKRIAELEDATGCEASSERSYHQGRLDACAEIKRASTVQLPGGSAQPASSPSG